jgi:hypothetical protein
VAPHGVKARSFIQHACGEANASMVAGRQGRRALTGNDTQNGGGGGMLGIGSGAACSGGPDRSRPWAIAPLA